MAEPPIQDLFNTLWVFEVSKQSPHWLPLLRGSTFLQIDALRHVFPAFWGLTYVFAHMCAPWPPEFACKSHTSSFFPPNNKEKS